MKEPDRQFPQEGGVPQLTGAELSRDVRAFWAKSSRSDGTLWLPVYQHLMDAADIAALLFDRYLAAPHRSLMASIWNGDEELARATLVLLAGVHDAGKISPEFSCQHDPLADLARGAGFDILPRHLQLSRHLLPHGYVSHFALQDVLVELGAREASARGLSAIVAVHHGRYPDEATFASARLEYTYGDASDNPSWQAVRTEIIKWMAARSGFDLAILSPRLPAIPVTVAAAYASAVVVADWLASNEEYFPLVPIDPDAIPLTATEQQKRVERGWQLADFPVPLRVPGSVPDVSEQYRQSFGWGTDLTPTRAQEKALQIARGTDLELMIVEAPPGSGKTELALAVAQELIRSLDLQGMIIALPTQATTDAMYARVTSWLAPIVAASGDDAGVFLAHGRNDLNEDFAGLLAKARHPVQTFDDDDAPAGASVNDRGLYASNWMTSRWRSTLSPVVIGTIDQVLLAALKSRHVLLRHLGLMAKVVVIDEVHASDSYMGTYLEAALTWLGMYRVPVVLLSATLPAKKRQGLVAAYRRGRIGRDVPDVLPELDGDIGYPALTTVSGGGSNVDVHRVFSTADRPEPSRSIRPLEVADAHGIAQLLKTQLRDGGCAVVIRNTVAAAQDTHEALAEHFPPHELMLTHARFMASDRAARDRHLLRLFGKGSAYRPHRHVVVSTQVIEQSLDVDFDLMLTDPAPMDLILQRIGRLHRHPGRHRPEQVREPVCHVVFRDRSSIPWTYLPGSDTVYGKYRVLRTAGILSAGPLSISDPARIAELTQLAYSDTDVVGLESWQHAMDQAHEKDRIAEHQAVDKATTWSLAARTMTKWKADALLKAFAGQSATGDESPKKGIQSRAAVRDGEDQIPVIVLLVDPFQGGRLIVPPWEEDDDGVPVALDVSVWPRPSLLRRIRSWALNLPPWQFRAGWEDLDVVTDAVADEIWNLAATEHWEWRTHPVLQGELLFPLYRESEFSHCFEADLHGKRVRYTPTRGLEVMDS